MKTGYARYLEVRDAFREKRPIPPLHKDYSKYTREELLELKQKADDWLVFHKDHPRYDEAVDRLHSIEQAITYLDALEVFGDDRPQHKQTSFS